MNAALANLQDWASAHPFMSSSVTQIFLLLTCYIIVATVTHSLT
jgi:hypothetical protein